LGTHNSVAWTESGGDNNNLLARNFPDDIGIITNTDGFQSFTAAINGYTLNPTIDWDYGYSASPINIIVLVVLILAIGVLLSK